MSSTSTTHRIHFLAPLSPQNPQSLRRISRMPVSRCSGETDVLIFLSIWTSVEMIMAIFPANARSWDMRTRSASMRSRLVCGFLRSVAMNDARRNTRRSSRIREWERDGEGDTSSFGLIVPDSIHIAFHFMMNSLFYIPLSKRHFPHQSSFAHFSFLLLANVCSQLEFVFRRIRRWDCTAVDGVHRVQV